MFTLDLVQTLFVVWGILFILSLPVLIALMRSSQISRREEARSSDRYQEIEYEWPEPSLRTLREEQVLH